MGIAAEFHKWGNTPDEFYAVNTFVPKETLDPKTHVELSKEAKDAVAQKAQPRVDSFNKQIKKAANKKAANNTETANSAKKAAKSTKEAAKNTEGFFKNAWKTIKNNKVTSALIAAAAILTVAVGVKHVKENKETKIASHQG